MKHSFLFLALAVFAFVAPCHADQEAYKKEISVTPLLKTQTDAAGKPIVWPGGTPEVTAVRVEIPPGKQTGWHKHPVPCFAYIIEGELSIELETGETKIVKAGQAFAETVNLLHNGTNKGTEPAKLVMFVAGESNKPFAEKSVAANAEESKYRMVELTLTSIDGQPAAGVEVDLIGISRRNYRNALQPSDAAKMPIPLSPWHFKTDEKGQVKIRLARAETTEEQPGWGAYHLVASGAERGAAVSGRIVHLADDKEVPYYDSGADEWTGHSIILKDDASATVPLQLKQGLRFSGRVIDTQGKGLPDHEIRVWLDLGVDTHTGYGGMILTRTAKTDAKGAFVVEDVYPNKFYFDESGSGDSGCWIKTTVRGKTQDEIIDIVQPQPDEKEISATLVLSPVLPYIYKGIVTGAGGKPLAGAKILIAPSAHRDNRTYGDNHWFENTTTDAKGRYEFRSTTKFIRFISVEAEGYADDAKEPDEGHLAPGVHSFRLKAKKKAFAR